MQIELLGQLQDLAIQTRRRDSFLPPGMNPTRKLDVLLHREVWNEIETLEDAAHLRSAVVISIAEGEVGQLSSEHLTHPSLRPEDAGDQTEKSRLPASGNSVNKDLLSSLDVKPVHLKDGRAHIISKRNILQDDGERHL
jgi:hypothetical protein